MLKWEDLSAFGDVGELEHVIELLRGHAEFLRESTLPRDHWAVRDNPFAFLRRQIERQYHATRTALEAERPGLFDRTYIAELLGRLSFSLNEYERNPYSMLPALHDLELDLHKALLAAYAVFDPESRRRMIEREAQEAIARERGRRGGEAKRGHRGPVRQLVDQLREDIGPGDFAGFLAALDDVIRNGEWVGELHPQELSGSVLYFAFADGREGTAKVETLRKYWRESGADG